ncbi:hypothetical protein ACG873_10340 [Mesorhizobium sp. AaZ16]|uniref:hypothetical protein n=1 Tax=Mesorhizobium sp. AaZ16 TaxID=3402289 RepID=UPI00374F1577
MGATITPVPLDGGFRETNLGGNLANANVAPNTGRTEKRPPSRQLHHQCWMNDESLPVWPATGLFLSKLGEMRFSVAWAIYHVGREAEL